MKSHIRNTSNQVINKKRRKKKAPPFLSRDNFTRLCLLRFRQLVSAQSGVGGFSFAFLGSYVYCLCSYGAHLRYARFSGLGFGSGVCSAREEFDSDGFSAFSGLSVRRVSGGSWTQSAFWVQD